MKLWDKSVAKELTPKYLFTQNVSNIYTPRTQFILTLSKILYLYYKLVSYCIE